MKNIKSLTAAALIGALSFGAISFAAPAMAQEASYKPGSVWVASRINVLPGQFENYMDYLAGSWKRIQEFGKKEGMVLSYHVLAVNNARQGEGDLVLLIESKDYMSNAQQEAARVKLNAFLATDNRKQDAASAGRGPMREQLGSTEYQELILK